LVAYGLMKVGSKLAPDVEALRAVGDHGRRNMIASNS